MFSLLKTGTCTYGDGCKYQHVKPTAKDKVSRKAKAKDDKKDKTKKIKQDKPIAEADQKQVADLAKTPCNMFVKGRCCFRQNCKYLT